MEILSFALRIAGMYFLALIMVRLLGKRALGELGPFDFVIMTGVGDTVISVALDRSMPFYDGIIVLATLAFLEYTINYVSIKNGKLSNLLTGTPVVLIDNGKVLKKNLLREKFNVDDLMQELRKKGIRDVNEVERAILESCGGFSVVLKEDEEPVKRKDLGIKAQESNSVLTIDQLPRGELFKKLEQVIQEEASPKLMDSLTNIENRLEQLSKQLALLEEQIRS
ncbi:Protein of unknown function DUF421 [Syntrophomonas zehnderi OL-4]|uniref:YetF C-terminal domain-containing protein n=1 Tax=Syntrophomonas zehnderi OL-4 TaxID=690567 RepID=A0A0E4GB35_9FIRM|nr:DUF421 domain-containing protein [Syntrophomonas zehnderi]CFX55115.1 Protein of unknown function DUF421 [Syntrophomonas zehnderi OL-4]